MIITIITIYYIELYLKNYYLKNLNYYIYIVILYYIIFKLLYLKKKEAEEEEILGIAGYLARINGSSKNLYSGKTCEREWKLANVCVCVCADGSRKSSERNEIESPAKQRDRCSSVCTTRVKLIVRPAISPTNVPRPSAAPLQSAPWEGKNARSIRVERSSWPVTDRAPGKYNSVGPVPDRIG